MCRQEKDTRKSVKEEKENKVKLVTLHDSSSEDVGGICSVNVRSRKADELMITVEVEGKHMSMEIDTGAKKSVISEKE